MVLFAAIKLGIAPVYVAIPPTKNELVEFRRVITVSMHIVVFSALRIGCVVYP